MKKIIAACAGAVATSTLVAEKLRELCQRNGIAADISQVRISEISSNLFGTSLIVTSGRVKKDFGIPLIAGTAFISGIGLEQTEAEILKILQGS